MPSSKNIGSLQVIALQSESAAIHVSRPEIDSSYRNCGGFHPELLGGVECCAKLSLCLCVAQAEVPKVQDQAASLANLRLRRAIPDRNFNSSGVRQRIGFTQMCWPIQ